MPDTLVSKYSKATSQISTVVPEPTPVRVARRYLVVIGDDSAAIPHANMLSTPELSVASVPP